MHPIEELQELPKKELLELWRKLPGKQPPPVRIDRLTDELAYRLQEQHHGKLDKNTTVSLRRHMAEFEKSLGQRRKPREVKTPPKIGLDSGSVLRRLWNGRTILVQVLGDRLFDYEGRRYKSLTAIAKEITGQHMSGPLFFGLKEVKRG